MTTTDPFAWLKADPLAAVLIRRGESREFTYDVVEQVARRTADGEDELTAILEVLQYVPHEVRAAVEGKC